MTLKVQETNINGIIQYVAEIHDMETDDKYAVLTCDPLGTIRSCSNNLLLFFGFKNVQDILGKDISTLFPSFEIAASGKDMKRIQTAARHSDGSQFDAIIELNEFSVAGELLWSYRVTRAKALQNSHKGKGGALAATVEEPVAHAPGSTESILQGVGQYVGNYRIGKRNKLLYFI